MKKESLYLDTSVPSAYYDNRAEERREATIRFWEEVLPSYQVCISTITKEELEATKDEVLRRNFESLVKGFNILKPNKKIRELVFSFSPVGNFATKLRPNPSLRQTYIQLAAQLCVKVLKRGRC